MFISLIILKGGNNVKRRSRKNILPLQRCINDIHVWITPDIELEEFNDIVRSAYSMLYLLATNIAQFDKRFQHDKIIGVGSAFDGTKIKELNEMDFVLHVNVPTDSTILVAGDDPCRAHISVSEGSKEQWKDMCDFSGYLSDNLLIPFKVLCVLRSLLIKAIEEINSNTDKQKIIRDSGELSLASNQIDGSGPNEIVYMQWMSANSKKVTQISIDIVFAFRCDKEILLDIRDNIRKDVWEFIWTESEGVGLVTPSRGSNKRCRLCSKRVCPCWVFQFSDIECKMVNKTIQNNHWKCYRVLKYICQSDFAIKNHTTLKCLSSNMIKNIVLEHDHTCFGKNTQECFIDIVNRLYSGAIDCFLPKFILPKTNIWCFDEETLCPKPPDQIISNLFEFVHRLKATDIKHYSLTQELQFIQRHLHIKFGQIDQSY